MGGETFCKTSNGQVLQGQISNKLLHALPTHLQIANCIKTVSKEKVIAVWKSFETIYSILNSWSTSKLEVDSYFNLLVN